MEGVSAVSTQELLVCNLPAADYFVSAWLKLPLTLINTSNKEQTKGKEYDRPQIETDQLERLYIFREKAEILPFLETKKFLLPLLEEAYITIRSYFPTSDLFLEVIIDPEIANERQLVVFIAIRKNAEEASEALDKLDEDWWMDNMDRAQGSLCITLEFI
jgi:hypothetical protein